MQRPHPAPDVGRKRGATLKIGGATLHLLASVAEKASSTRVRAAARSGIGWKGLLDPAVVEYIRKEHLYKGTEARR